MICLLFIYLLYVLVNPLGLQYLHSENKPHGNIREDNIFVEKMQSNYEIGQVIIAGYNPFKDIRQILHNSYTAPEVFQNRSHSTKSDIW